MSHDNSEIILICWFAAQETSLIIINVENSCASYCIGKHGTIIFLQDSLMNRKLRRTAFDLLNVFLVN